MALTIEDGTGVSGADSFATLVEFAAIQVELFETALEGTDAAKEAALRRAWYYMKSLSWDMSDDDNQYPTFGGTIPEDVKIAQVVFARAEQSEANALAPSVTPANQKILTQVGEISWTPLAQAGVDSQRTVVTFAADLLKDYLSGSGSTTFLARA